MLTLKLGVCYFLTAFIMSSVLDESKYCNYDEFYYPSVCHVCKVKSTYLKNCKKCKSYRYCSVDHQKRHWPVHKFFCKILHKFSNHNCLSANDWLQYRIKLKINLERGVLRPLTPGENQVWMFPRVCAVCYKTDKNVLFDCLHCPSVSYCSKEHQLLHKDAHSKICLLMNRQYRVYCSRLDEINEIMPDRALSFQDASKYFSVFSDTEKILDDEVNCLGLGDRLSHVLTIINCLSICNLIVNFNISQEHLTVHIVGVTYECSNFNRQICELMFHWLENLKCLHLVFVGPELADHSVPEWEFCDLCQNKGRAVHFYFEPILYSQYFSSSTYRIPNLIAIFNCGFHELNDSEFDLWGESLPMLLIPNVPLLLTSYTYEESLEDLKRIRNLFDDISCIEIVKECEKNPYCSPIPLRDWINVNEIYFNNYYFSIIKKL